MAQTSTAVAEPDATRLEGVEDRGGLFRLAVFTDTFDDVNGVATIYRQLARIAAGSASPAVLEVYCLAEEQDVDSRGHVSVRRYRARPSLSVPRYPELSTGYPPARRIASDFRKADYDAVLVATPGPMGFLGRFLARRAGLPLVGFYHTRFPAYLAVYFGALVKARKGAELAEKVGYRWMRQLYNACDLVICQSSSIADEVRIATEAPVAIWDTGVDTQLYRPGDSDEFRERWGIPNDAVVAEYIGRLAPEKNLHQLAEISHLLADLEFLFVGDGPGAAELRRTARATFTGFLLGDELAAAYRAGDMFVFPSITDTFGMVLLEAMASGLPLVVAKDGPGAELVARSGGGVTFDPDDPRSLEECVARLAASTTERAERSRRARSYAEANDWSTAFARLVEFCRTAARVHSKPHGVPVGDPVAMESSDEAGPTGTE